MNNIKEMNTSNVKVDKIYRQFFKDSLAGSFISTPAGKLIDCNKAFLNILGFKTKKEALERNSKELYRVKKKRAEKIEKIKKYRKLVNYEEEILKITGEPIYVISNLYGEFENDKLVLLKGSILDITSRKRYEEGVQEKTDRLSAILDSTKEWIWSINLKGVHIYSNPAVKSILGYSPEKLVGNSSFDLMHKDDRKIITKNIKKWISEKRGWESHVIRWKHKNGTWRFLESSAVPIIDADGSIQGWHGVDRDITDSYKIREELQASERKLNIIFESAPDAIYIMDFKGTLIEGNRTAEKMLGYSREELIGKNLLKSHIISNSSLAIASKRLFQNMQGKRTGPDELILIRKDLSPVPVEITSHPIEINGNKVVIGIARDISNRKENEKKYLAIFNNANDGIALIKDEKFVEVNKMAEKMFGRSRKELTNIDPWHPSITPKTFSDKIAKEYGREQLGATLRKDSAKFEWIHLRRNGKTFEVEVSLSKIIIDGQAYAQAIMRDISDRKKAEKELNEYKEHLEELVKKRTKELEKKTKQLDDSLKVFVGREQTIIRQRDQIKKLELQLKTKEKKNDYNFTS